MTSEDHKLLCQIAQGDVKSLGILYVLYSAKVYNFALSLLQNPVEAEDITQEIFLKIWNSRETLSEVRSLKSYLFGMTHHAVLNLIKSKDVRSRYNKRAAESLLPESVEVSSPLETAELEKSISEALEGMSELRKTIFRLSREEHKTYQEIADLLMISPKTVQYHISCALAALREII